MIEAHLYRKPRPHALDAAARSRSVLRPKAELDETVRALRETAGLNTDELRHVYLNGRLLSTANSMAPWLEYPEGKRQVLDTVVAAGERLGLFAHDMAILVL